MKLGNRSALGFTGFQRVTPVMPKRCDSDFVDTDVARGEWSERLTKFHFFDADYVERLRSGDSQTQQDFVDYFGALIRLKLGRRLRSPSTIEDIRQETIARVWAALTDGGRLLRPEKLGPFVNSVCNNVLFEHYRKASREIVLGDEVAINTPDQAKDAADLIADMQMQEAVRETLNRLSERDRFLLEEVFLNERDKDDVCQEMSVNREYLRVLLFRAKKSFRAYLEHHASEQQGHDHCVQTLDRYHATQISGGTNEAKPWSANEQG